MDIPDFLFQSVVFLSTFLISLLWFFSLPDNHFKEETKKRLFSFREVINWLFIDLFLFILLLIIMLCSNHNLDRLCSPSNALRKGMICFNSWVAFLITEMILVSIESPCPADRGGKAITHKKLGLREEDHGTMAHCSSIYRNNKSLPPFFLVFLTHNNAFYSRTKERASLIINCVPVVLKEHLLNISNTKEAF